MQAYPTPPYTYTNESIGDTAAWMGCGSSYDYSHPSDPNPPQIQYSYTYEAPPYYPNYPRHLLNMQDPLIVPIPSETYTYHQYGDVFTPRVTYGVSDAYSLAAPHPLSQVKEEPLDQGNYFNDPTPSEFTPSRSATPARQGELVPPNEVPLRATGAPPEMKKMMGVFRVNPFAYGRSGAVSTLYDGPAHPLEREPEIFEFQVDLWDAPTTEPLEDDDLERFTPELDSVALHNPYGYIAEETSPLSSEPLDQRAHSNCDSSPQLSYPSPLSTHIDQAPSDIHSVGQSSHRRHSLPSYYTTTHTQLHTGYIF